MKCLIQRVKHASVTIEGNLYSKIGHGILAFVGVEKGDTIENAEKLADKVLKLRIFEDENGKMNRSISDISGEILIVSQFTLCGDCQKGTRPSFDNSEKPDLALKLYEDFINIVRKSGIGVQTGKFAAMMDIELINDGPVTFLLQK
ncbi:MAG: D-aminoacyl-tRNA deacylase [Candidatus Gastranaerophilaceae bacterium]